MDQADFLRLKEAAACRAQEAAAAHRAIFTAPKEERPALVAERDRLWVTAEQAAERLKAAEAELRLQQQRQAKEQADRKAHRVLGPRVGATGKTARRKALGKAGEEAHRRKKAEHSAASRAAKSPGGGKKKS